MRKVDDVINTDHVIAADLVEAACLAPSGVTCLLDAPLQAAGVLIRKSEQLLDTPEGRHFLVVAGPLGALGLKNIVMGVPGEVKCAEKTKNGGIYSLYTVK